MAEKSSGGARKITVTLRPRSAAKNQRPTRRKQVTGTKDVVFSDTSKNHNSTSFPLFSSNLLSKKPPAAYNKKPQHESTTSKQSVVVNHASRIRLQPGEAKSPTPVEQVTSSSDINSSHISLSSVSKLSLKSEVITAPGRHGDSLLTEHSQSLSGSPISDVYSDYGDVFPIQYLPDDCLLKIFSLLPSHDKGRCAQVKIFLV